MKCEICSKQFDDLRSHLRKHKMTWQEYREAYGVNPNRNIILPVSEKERIAKDSFMRGLARTITVYQT